MTMMMIIINIATKYYVYHCQVRQLYIVKKE